MEGCLYQRGKAGIWYLRYDVESAPGEPRFQKNERIGKMSKGDAEICKRKILSKVDDGAAQEVRSAATVGTFLASWLDAVRDRLAATTYARYADIVERHINPTMGRVKLAKVRPEHVRQVDQAVKAKGLAGRTRLSVHRVLHTAFGFAVREERLLKENPVSRVKAPRADNKELEPMSFDKVRVLIEAAKGTRLEAPVAFGAFTGLRRGELLGLRWRNIDFEKGSLFVTQALEQTRSYGVRFKPPKSKSSRRFIPLAPECIDILRQQRDKQEEAKARFASVYAENDLVFCNEDGSPWPPATFTAQFGKMASMVGLKGFRFHDVRHAFATLTLANGTPLKEVQALMGHSTANTTLSFYARTMEGLGREAVNNLARSLSVS